MNPEYEVTIDHRGTIRGRIVGASSTTPSGKPIHYLTFLVTAPSPGFHIGDTFTIVASAISSMVRL